MNPERAVLAALTAALFGVVYAGIIHIIYRTDPHHPYTALMVVFGVSGTLAAAAIIVPVEYLGIFLVLFAVTGLPQIVGSMLRESQERRRILDEAQRTIRESLPE